MGQAAGGEVPERVDPDVQQDKCQGLALKNMFALKIAFHFHSILTGDLPLFFVDSRLSHRFRF